MVAYKYEFFENRNYQIKDGTNIIGHIIPKFCDMQSKNNTLFDVNYDVIWFENKPIHTCDILRNGKVREAILVTGEESKEKSFSILKKYMYNNFINQGIIIVGTTWNMIDGNEKISIDFKNNIDIDVFKSFMI